MITLKWKLYRILNYVLLIIATLIFLIITVLTLDDLGREVETDAAPFFVAFGFLLMVGQCIVNSYIFSSNFPNKPLTGKKLTLHIIASSINFLCFLGMAVISIAGIMSEFNPNRNNITIGGIMLVASCLLITLIDTYIFLGQLTLYRYLKQNNEVLIDSLINSIGNNTEDTE